MKQITKPKLWLGIGLTALSLGITWQTFFGSIQHTKNLSLPKQFSVYEDFSIGAKLIDKGKFTEALTGAVQIKNTIEQSDMGFVDQGYLYILNLYRIGLLHKQLNQPQEELTIWSAFETIQNDASHPLQAPYYRFIKTLSHEDLDGKDFIQNRQKELSKQMQ